MRGQPVTLTARIPSAITPLAALIRVSRYSEHENPLQNPGAARRLLPPHQEAMISPFGEAILKTLLLSAKGFCPTAFEWSGTGRQLAESAAMAVDEDSNQTE